MDGETPQEGAETAQETPETGAEGTPATGEVEAKLRTAREEAISERKKRQELEAKVKEFEDAKLSETEKATKRIAELEAAEKAKEQRVQELALELHIERAARKGGAKRPEAVYRLVDLASITYEDDGTPKDLDGVIAKAREDYPELFGASSGSGDGGPRGTPVGGEEPDMNQLLRAAARGKD